MKTIRLQMEDPNGETEELGNLELRAGSILIIKINDNSTYRQIIRNKSDVLEQFKLALSKDSGEPSILIIPPFIELKVLNKSEE